MKKLFFLLLTGTVLLGLGCERQQFGLEPEEDRKDEDEIIIVDYLQANNLMEDAVRHESGVYYIIEEEGEGASSPTASSQILVRYKGTLLDGTVFDETEEEDAVLLNLSRTIDGWRFAIPLIKRGGKIQFFVPSNLAYGINDGNRGRAIAPGIPEYAVLYFEVELVNFL
ncbi:FKBP-type peptidyl-prolyl cis-trans isomerase [Phaeodactylibacter xiamenensis]|jgi:FKBP-type peptidyl-prolyl cis-trans isomerase|uniref:FKBP-type peptidyl-prolyl cis-trans isomerase n=1 Tax=Phaeodactylibacter xiamenensis TaxID=1524460 RepID=UPI0024AA008C|nr:FKBP-type peptidyl-prolyl cis-trans isomerase [Phaeodactylibacter xiamenensis]